MPRAGPAAVSAVVPMAQMKLGTATIDTADGAPGTIVVGDVVGLRARIAGTESTRLAAPVIALGQSALQPVRGLTP